MKGHLCKWKDNYISYFETDFFITITAALHVYCLPEFLLHDNTENFLKARFHWAIPETSTHPHGRHWKSCKKCLVSMTGNPWTSPNFVNFDWNSTKTIQILAKFWNSPRSRISKFWNPAKTATVILGNPVIFRYPTQVSSIGGVWIFSGIAHSAWLYIVK